MTFNLYERISRIDANKGGERYGACVLAFSLEEESKRGGIGLLPTLLLGGFLRTFAPAGMM
ncbi:MULTISPECIES: hypothetical protein [Marinomonas]|uniref:hypothetical protein n=1 Tax=Marinomonas TaxID=28253 RepID=UPI0013A6CD0D|nr:MULTISPECIES: hypothetical protein [Marinomonas]